jgi:hypothetical protein
MPAPAPASALGGMGGMGGGGGNVMDLLGGGGGGSLPTSGGGGGGLMDLLGGGGVSTRLVWMCRCFVLSRVCVCVIVRVCARRGVISHQRDHDSTGACEARTCHWWRPARSHGRWRRWYADAINGVSG